MGTATLLTLHLISFAFGVVALVRVGTLPDERVAHGNRTRVAWTLAILLFGFASLLPVGTALAWWRTRPTGSGRTGPRAGMIGLADGAPVRRHEER